MKCGVLHQLVEFSKKMFYTASNKRGVMTERIAIYPGTFDPITKGHMDVIRNSLSICDRLIIAVAEDIPKTPIFTAQQRAEMVYNDLVLEGLSDRVTTVPFGGLLIDFAQKNNATLLIRGLRAVSDFEYEFQLAGMNAKLCADVQTVFLPASGKHQFLASRLVKEVARLGGDVSEFVSPHVVAKLKEYYAS
jgi:pantetheine-phosphate adenylyltransferase